MYPTEHQEQAEPPCSLEACYAKHHARVYLLGLRYGGGNNAWAEDLTHDVFVCLAEKKDELDSLEDIGGWLYRVASNLAVSRLRRERSLWRRVSTKLSATEPRGEPSADIVIEQQQLSAMAVTALTRLPPKQRVVISMKILDDKSQREIADTLALSEGYVSKLIARGLRRIRRQGWEAPSC